MAQTEFDYSAFLKNLTQQPGVYRMYDKAGDVIYVGKAKDLKKRVSSYFRSNLTNQKTVALVRQIHHIDVTVTHTETEALILENNYIKQFLPKYNVLLRDDKSYPFILVSDHQHPRLAFHRGAKKNAGQYFGPYPSGGAVRESLRVMQKVFPVRQCEDSYYQARTRPCLQYQLKRCLAPCVDGYVSDEAYNEQVQLVKLFLQGRSQEVINLLVDKMDAASQSLAFEKAAQYRDQLAALRKVQEQQYVTGNHKALDIIGFAYQHGVACIHLLFIRDGKILGSKSFFPKMPKSSEAEEVLTSFVAQYYLNQNDGRRPGKEIILPQLLSEQTGLQTAIQELYQESVQLVVPSRGEKYKYLQLASTNAQNAVNTRLTESLSMQRRFEALDLALELAQPIERIECFDISHTMGQQTVASCVVFNRSGPLKTDYRKYNIEGITPGDDYAAMAQVLSRRYKSSLADNKIPDVIFIDGGKGQLAQAEAHFANWSGKMPLLVGVAKGVTRKPGLETLILAGSHQTLNLESHSPALHLIQHIRDESHRFAITGHRARRQKVKTTSSVESIPGVGAKRRQALLKYLGGMQELKNASVDEIAKVPGISRQLAETVFSYLHDKTH
ncbi:excinuclease ABC subunit UvrC [Catenovulum sp. 2E275]|uniref:excinuclease ABC subunit UvrC n=1 Tax=Catenovulum sp. 2E275 TaxID=2980497 RepID=UPI0021CE7494|nr:excinuclease ABC subunit UvrC [Catenovulum sp. 2E275]MCU4677546.1 excinuclease ABC subunit UvrC [Catenovulum sp. 2E275]